MAIDPSVFNANRDYEKPSQSIFLGQPLGLVDSVNRPHQRLFDLYKLQKSMDWDENEFQLQECSGEFLSRPRPQSERMLNTVGWQWEGDSAASHSIAPVVAPFVTDDDAWMGYQRISDNESLHALSYSEIVKLGLGGDARQRMAEILQNQASLKRLETVANSFAYVKRVGAKIILGDIRPQDDEAIDAAMIFVVTLLSLERIQFISSFAVTFALGEIGAFMPIVETVQKICADEWTIHVPFGKYIIQNERRVLRSAQSLARIEMQGRKIIDEVTAAELSWNKTLNQDGYELPGVTESMLADFSLFGTQDVYDTLGWKNPHKEMRRNPLPYVNDWVDINRNQGSPQEKKSGNYLLGKPVQSNRGLTVSADDL